MKKVKVEIIASVTGYINVPDDTTDAQIEKGFPDIYFRPLDKNMEDSLAFQKEDLGADIFVVRVLESEIEGTYK